MKKVISLSVLICSLVFMLSYVPSAYAVYYPWEEPEYEEQAGVGFFIPPAHSGYWEDYIPTEANGAITLYFSGGTLLPSQLSDLWARVKYDGQTYYWNLDPGLLATDGTSFTIQFDSTFNGKLVKLD